MGGKRISEEVWDKVRVIIALTLIEDGETSSANCSAYADQLGETDVTTSRAHHELERWYANGWLIRGETWGTFYYRLSIDGVEQGVIDNV